MTHVLVPLDGSALAEAVVPVVLTLAPARLTLLHATEDDDPPAAAEALFVAALERVGAGGPKVQTLVRRGRAADAILAAAQEVGASLIALSTHGRTGLNRLVLGSVAEEVTRAAPAPVLLVRAGAPAGARPVLASPLVGYDGSERAWRAVEALGLLGRGRLGRLDLLVVHDLAPIQGRPDDLMERLLARERQTLLERVERAAERARGLGLEASASVREGRPSTTLIEAAEQQGNTVIVVATHGRSLLTRWIFGSVAEELLHASPLPLLIAR